MDAVDEHTAVVLAGGGERVTAWETGVLAGLADEGVDLRSAGTIVGTSADAVLDGDRAVSRVVIIAAMPTDLRQLDAAGVETYLVRATQSDLEAMDSGRTPAERAGREAGRSVGPALRQVLQPRPPRTGAQRRLRSGAAVLALVGAAAFAPSAQAAVSVGQAGTDPAPADKPCFGQYFQETRSAGGPNYVIPTRGVITSWSAEGPAGDKPAPATLKVADGDQMVGESPIRALPPGETPTFDVRIPVQGGDRIGLAVLNADSIDVCGTRTGSPNDAAGQTTKEVSPPQRFAVDRRVSGLRVNVSAVVEPDTDRDGFGDETQDDCPSDPRSQGKCVGVPVDPPANPEQPAPPTPVGTEPDPPAQRPGTPSRPAAPARPPVVVAPRDTLAPGLAARAARRQRVARSRRLIVRVAPSETASLVASARVNVRGVRLRPVRSNSGAGQAKTLRLRASKAGARRLRAALRRKRPVVATVRLTARDTAGNTATRTLRVRIVG